MAPSQSYLANDMAMSASAGGRFFKRRKMSTNTSASQQAVPSDEDWQRDHSTPSHDARSTATSTRFPSTRPRAISTTSAASSSLPSRSYIHNVSHGNQSEFKALSALASCLVNELMVVDVHYSSSGVREQTAELSSSFMEDSDMAVYFGPDRNDSDATPVPQGRVDPITELSEPTTPNGFEVRETPAPSAAQDALLRYTAGSSQGSDQRPPDAPDHVPEVIVTDEDEPSDETEPLLPRERLSSNRKRRYDATSDLEDQATQPRGIWNRLGHRYPHASLKRASHFARTLATPKLWDLRQVAHVTIVRPISMLPAVFLGVLLNLLDALSYGIILFPLGEDVFSQMGADGVSMFYVSCIVSQLVYSTGSIFRGGVGSEMVCARLVTVSDPAETD